MQSRTWGGRVNVNVRAARDRRRRTRNIVLAGIALAALGPGRPIVLTALQDAARSRGPAVVERVRTEALDGPGSWTVDIDLIDETSQPRYVEAQVTLPPPSASKRHALVIGINEARGGKRLPGSITDANNVRDALLMYGFKRDNIMMLLDGAATRSAILDGLERLAQRTPEHGTAVVAIATHSRRSGGHNELLTADGRRISSYELSSALRKVRGRLWTALPTCYSAGYALPGIVGKDRIATFASSADEPAYQLGHAGSFLIMTMVAEAMLERRAPGSVEDAFAYAKRELEARHPRHVPSMSDGIRGDLLLGDPPRARAGDSSDVQAISRPDDDGGPPHHAYTTTATTSRRERPDRDYDAEPDAEPSEAAGSSSRSGDGGFGVCGTYRYRC